MKIRKISQPLNVEGAVINSLEGNSTTNAPSIAAVKEALNGYILYDNPQGGTSDITLSDSVSNYKYIDIFYNKGGSVYNSKRIDNPNNKQLGLDIAFMEADDHSQLAIQRVTFMGNSIIYGIGLWTNFVVNGNTYSSDHIDEPLIRITKVLGYK